MMASKLSEKDFKPDQAPVTADYVPSLSRGMSENFFKIPPFTFQTITYMLADFRIRWGLWMLKGPILCKAKFFVKCDRPDVKEFLVNNITRFWRTSAVRSMKAFEYGYSCSEAVYKTEDGDIRFDYLRDLQPMDCKALTWKGSVTGARLSNIPTKGSISLMGPKKFWHVHNREWHPYYGNSRLYGAYMPWIEIWGSNGYRASRKLYFYKNAMDGGGIYVPPGSTPTGKDGNNQVIMTPNWILGRDFVEKKKSGGTFTLPGETDEKGNRKWEIVPPSVTAPPTNIMEYGETLKDEEWEGMGIPPEIARAEGTGAFAGRIVPLMGFYTTLQELLYWMIHDADEQIFRPLVDFKFGPGVTYEIIPFSLMDEALKAEQNEMGSGGGPGVQQDQQQAALPQNPLSGKGVSMAQLGDDEAAQRLHAFLFNAIQQTATTLSPNGAWTIAV